MGGFRDTFTKDDGKEEQLGYDDTAFYYFACTILIAVALPWTYYVVKSVLFPDAASQPGKTKAGSKISYCKTAGMVEKQGGCKKTTTGEGGSNKWFWIQVLILACIWSGLYVVVLQLGNEKEINKFDPFEILEVTPSTSAADIKKAYRKLSLVYHPDKNPDDPLAASYFIQITKAYSALTDETARRNYEKYGNPDGPQASKSGIGLPRFLLEKDNQFMILCIFFMFLLFIVPMTFICYYQRTKNYAANGCMIETLQFLGYYINESTRVKNCPELMAASAESRAMETRPGDNSAMRPLGQEVVEHKKRQFEQPVIAKSSFLIWAHMQRLHHLMTPELREDCDTLLKHSIKISQAMIEIACMREWFYTAQAMIDYRRSLIQALDIKSSQLLQIPHFTEETAKVASKSKGSSTIQGFITQDAAQRKGISGMEPQQLLDIDAFAAHVSNIEMKAIVEVEDEEEIVTGDIATVTFQMKRNNLKEGESAGPVHAPLFPELKMEEWWIFLTEAAPSSKIIASEKIRDSERFVECKMRFPISKPGKYRLDLHAMCDSYVGLDQKLELSFSAKREEDVKREIIIHKEDADLDLQPTLFQQFMGDFGQDEESEEEEEEGSDKKKEKADRPANKPAKKDVKETVSKGNEKKSDTEDSTKQSKDEDSDSSNSSSDSD